MKNLLVIDSAILTVICREEKFHGHAEAGDAEAQCALNLMTNQ
jgi:hypothetical protein